MKQQEHQVSIIWKNHFRNINLFTIFKHYRLLSKRFVQSIGFFMITFQVSSKGRTACPSYYFEIFSLWDRHHSLHHRYYSFHQSVSHILSENLSIFLLDPDSWWFPVPGGGRGWGDRWPSSARAWENEVWRGGRLLVLPLPTRMCRSPWQIYPRRPSAGSQV